jgi:hypothetical protein
VPPGRPIAAPKFAELTEAGFWLVLDECRILVDFREFPWFRGRSREELQNVERPFADELRWPELDVDLAVDSLLHPKRYPLRFGGG